MGKILYPFLKQVEIEPESKRYARFDQIETSLAANAGRSEIDDMTRKEIDDMTRRLIKTGILEQIVRDISSLCYQIVGVRLTKEFNSAMQGNLN